ncbi:MAG: tectonin domain-containing protein [Deltaproteobacteria bacterium]|jgi:hypothetical protein
MNINLTCAVSPRRRGPTLALTFVAVAACGGPVDGGSEALGLDDSGPEVELVNAYLARSGYFPNDEIAQRWLDWVPAVAEGPAAPDVFDARTQEAVEIFQAAHGLEVTGVADEETIAMMNAPRCGNPVRHAGADDDKWHHDAQYSSPYAYGATFLYRVEGMPGQGWTVAQRDAAVAAAFAVWHPHISVRFVQTTGSSHALIRFRMIDGPGGTLGLTYNNYWGGSRHSIDMDTWEGWTPNGSVNMSNTLVHEIGHMLGFDHSGIGGAVMFPTGGTFGTAVLHDDDLAATTFRYRRWNTTSGLARDIDSGAAGTWVVGEMYGGPGGAPIYRRVGNGWSMTNGHAVRVAVGDVPWVVNAGGYIYRRLGVTSSNPSGTSWYDVSYGQRAFDVGAGSAHNAWIVSRTPRGAGGYAIMRFTGSNWVEVGGAAVRISVGADGTVHVVNAAGYVYERSGITASNPNGSYWRRLTNLAPNSFGNETGVAVDVSTSRTGIAWAVGTADGAPYTFVRQEQPSTTAGGGASAFDRWVPIPGGGTNIGVYDAHDPWMAYSNYVIRRRGTQ